MTTSPAARSLTRRPTRRVATIVSLLAIPAAVAVSGLVVSQASYSAYSATTVNPTSNWASGTVALNDDDNNAAAFTASGLKPGSTGTKCIVVTSTGTLASDVKVYATAAAMPTTDLVDHLQLTVTQGTGGSFGSCTGFTPLASGADLYSGTFTRFGMTYNSYANGLGGWTTTGSGNESRTYRISYAVDADAPNSTQGGTVSGNLIWEAQNN